jgi:hypothetical protein
MAVNRSQGAKSGHESSLLGHHPLLTEGVTLPPVEDEQLRVAWLTAVHAAIRASKGLVIGELLKPAVGQNFYSIAVQHPKHPRAELLLNAPGRLVSMVDAAEGSPSSFRYLPVPEPAIFRDQGFTAVSVADLERELVEADLEQLSKWERRDVKYHEPARVGDVLFNWFD